MIVCRAVVFAGSVAALLLACGASGPAPLCEYQGHFTSATGESWFTPCGAAAGDAR